MAGLNRVAGVGFDGSTISTTFGRQPVPLLKASYGDTIEPAFLSYMGSQSQDEQTPGSYKTDPLKITMSSVIFRTVFLPAMPQNAGGSVRIPIVIGRQHPDMGDDSDLLEDCRWTNAAAAVENSNKAEETELTFSVRQIKWSDARKTINQIIQAGELPTGAIASGF